MSKQIFSLELALRANNTSTIPTTSNSQLETTTTKTTNNSVVSQTKIISDIFLPKNFLNNNQIFLNSNFANKNYLDETLENISTHLCSNDLKETSSSPNNSNNNDSIATILQTTSNNTVCKRLYQKVCPCMSCILGGGSSTKPLGATRRKPSINQIRKMSEPNQVSLSEI